MTLKGNGLTRKHAVYVEVTRLKSKVYFLILINTINIITPVLETMNTDNKSEDRKVFLKFDSQSLQIN